MRTKEKHVVIAFHLATEAGQRKLNGFFNYLTEHNLHWHTQIVRSVSDFNADFVRSLPSRRIDGIVYSLFPEPSTVQELSRISTPTVALDSFDDNALLGRQRNLASVTSASDEVGLTAANYLLSLGKYQHYAFVPAPHNPTWSKLREKAFVAEMKRFGSTVSVYRVKSAGYDLPQLVDWLAALPRPAGVFVACDDRAIQVIEACHDAELSVPEEVAVISVDNDELVCTHTTPTLTSIQPDHERAGYMAAERLDAMMNGKTISIAERHVVKVKTIAVRESTAPVSNAGKLVQRALAFIRLNVNRPIRARDVVSYLKVSRRLADLRFGELQGKSIGTTIRETKLEEVARRLRNTSDTIENIANNLCFSNISRLQAMFRAHYGKTMTAFRTEIP